MKQVLGQSTATGAARSGYAGLAPSSARSTPAGNSVQAFFQLNVRRSLQMHWGLARTVAFAVAVLAVVYLLAQIIVLKSWPVYLAESIVYVQPTPAKVLEPSQGGLPRWPYDSNTYETYIQQQMMNVSRDDVLAGALHRLVGFQKPGESDQAAARRLVQMLLVTREGAAYQFSIGARAHDPQMAAQIANAVTASYIESASRDARSGDAQRLSMLSEEKDRIQNALTADRAEQGALNRQLGVASVGSAVPDHYDEDITQIHTELVKARAEHDAAEAKFAALDAGHGLSSAAIDAEADEMIASDAGLVSMKTALNTRRAVLISQMANLTPVSPQYKQDEEELTKIDNTLDAMVKDLRAKAAARIQLQLRADLQRTAGVEAQLNGQLRQLAGAAGGATPKLRRSSDLAADITRLQARYARVDEQLHNLMLEDSAPAPSYQVMPAMPPLNRTKSGVFRNALLIVLAGLFFGVLAAVTANKLDPKIYIASDVERLLGFQPMAQLPDFAEVPEGVAEEYLLRLASSLEHSRKQGNLRSCIVTGTGPGTGVSTLVNRVRTMLEAMGRPTVLVDATGAPGPASRAGVSAKVTGSSQGLVPVERVSRQTALLQQMAEEAETGERSLVLTDTAPLAVSAETEYLARFVDCVLVVIESGMTTRAELRNSARILERLDVRAVGFVLNRVGLAKADPAFRLEVEAVAKHLHSQDSNWSQRTEPNGVFAAAAPAVVAALAAEDRPRGRFEPEGPAAAAAVARLSAHPDKAPPVDPAVCHSSPVASARLGEAAKPLSIPVAAAPADKYPSRFTTAAAPAQVSKAVQLAARVVVGAAAAPVPPRVVQSFVAASAAGVKAAVEETPSTAVGAAVPQFEPAPAPAREPIPPAGTPQSELPWWLSDVPAMPAPSRAPLIWQPARKLMSGSAGPGGETFSSAPVVADQPQAPWTQSWERVPGLQTGAPAEVIAGEGPGGSREETPGNLTSRLSGLRNLLFVLGMKDGQKGNEQSERRPGLGSDFDPRSERTISQGPASAGGAQGASPRLVTAPPEFLPPKPTVIDFDKLADHKGESPSRKDRRAAADGVEILPSKRGQYKKV